jgi:NitT/TauT family transport system substrate-binding protein
MPIKAVLATSLTLTALVAFDGTASAQSPKVWRHGMVEAKSDSGIVMMPGEGFAEKRGLKIEYMQFKGDAIALKALIAGELDSYEGSPGGPMIAASRGADVKIVGCYWPGLTYGVFVGKDVNKPEDLKGKTFAISSPGSLPDLFARSVLEKYKINSDDVKFAALGSDSDRFRAVSGGVVQAAAASTEFTPLVEKQGIRMLLHAHDVAPNYIRFCTYMGSKTIATKPAEAANFLAAQMEGFKYALSHRDETVALSKKMTDAKPEDEKAGYVFDEVKKYSAVDPMMPIPHDKLAWMQDLLVRTGNLTAPLDLNKMIDPSIREKAVAAIGGH